jgi:hypothetical protein
MDDDQVNQPELETPTDEVTNDETQTDQTLTTEEPQTGETNEVSTQPVSEPTEEDSEDEDESFTGYGVAPQYELPPLDFSAIPQNEDGTLDADSLAQALQQRDNNILQQAAQMVQQQEENRQEERLWQKAREAKPELKNKDLAREVNAMRFGLFAEAINNGEENARLLTPMQTYSRLEKRFSQAKADGVRQATESVRVQESAYVEPTQSAGKSDKADEQKLFGQMRSPNRAEADAAADAILRKRLFG